MEVPNYIANNIGLTTLIKNGHTGRPYTDNLCFFRCLALSNGHKITALERPTDHLLSVYRTATGNPLAAGMTLENLSVAERVFQKTIQVYALIPTQDDQDPGEIGVNGREHAVQCGVDSTFSLSLPR